MKEKGIIFNSIFSTPTRIFRFVLGLLFIPATLLPMFYAGHKTVSLLAFIFGVANHGMDISRIMSENSYLFAVGAVWFLIIIALVGVVSNLFSADKGGFLREITINLSGAVVFGIMSLVIAMYGGHMKIGFFVIMALFAVCLIFDFLNSDVKDKQHKFTAAVSASLCVVLALGSFLMASGGTKISQSVDAERSKKSVAAVSFNVAAPWGSKIDGTDSLDRCSRFAEYMNYIHPEFIGTQEMNSTWMKELEKKMPDYDSYGVKRGGDDSENKSEMNSVFWLKDEYTLVDKDTFWLSDTQEIESKYTYTDENGQQQQAGCNRVCTYVVLKSRETGTIYIHMNTHLDNASDEARLFGARAIAGRIGALRWQYGDKVNIILTGDFNTDKNSRAIKTLSSTLNVEPVNKATYQDWGYTDTGDEPIDFIFTSGKIKRSAVASDLHSGYVSDHYGVLNVIRFKTK